MVDKWLYLGIYNGVLKKQTVIHYVGFKLHMYIVLDFQMHPPTYKAMNAHWDAEDCYSTC